MRRKAPTMVPGLANRWDSLCGWVGGRRAPGCVCLRPRRVVWGEGKTRPRWRQGPAARPDSARRRRVGGTGGQA